jgi:(p)ppGpp synthase/HD superfamily hydrolase
VASVANGDRGLTNICIDSYGREMLLIEEGGFRYKVCLAYSYDHAKARRGYESSYKELSDESEPEIEPPQEKQIKIFLKDGSVVYLPTHSTPIDVGFKIHREMGYAVCGALVNGKEKPITTRLREGDHVVVKTTDKAKDGSRPTTAKIAWLYHVKSDEARKCLIRFFSLRYEGLHSEDVTATNEEADRVFDAAMRALKAV